MMKLVGIPWAPWRRLLDRAPHLRVRIHRCLSPYLSPKRGQRISVSFLLFPSISPGKVSPKSSARLFPINKIARLLILYTEIDITFALIPSLACIILFFFFFGRTVRRTDERGEKEERRVVDEIEEGGKKMKTRRERERKGRGGGKNDGKKNEHRVMA